MTKRILIMGAAGRDFHNFNVVYRDNPTYEVVAFTAAQIPHMEGRMFPPELAGPRYPQGIPIYAESRLADLIKTHRIDQVVFSYSDVSHEEIMHKASLVIGMGADFVLLGANQTMLQSQRPVIAVCAVRTGCGKSQTTRRVSEILKKKGRRVVVVRHPMPYGDLARQSIQRFATPEDMDREHCTIEEREEYEPHLAMGNVIYAGVDYEAILRGAEKEADVLLWDGGNNDLPFYRPTLWITVADPHRAGHELRYFPGETNFRMADVIVINKVDTASPDQVSLIRRHVERVNPKAIVIEAASPVEVDRPEAIRDQRVLVVEDGPTLTHGEMAYGAGIVAARQFGAREVVDPRPFIQGSLRETFEAYPEIGPLLPAMGYGSQQMRDLEETIAQVPCDTVILGTPVDLTRIIRINRPVIRVTYRLQEIRGPRLEDCLHAF